MAEHSGVLQGIARKINGLFAKEKPKIYFYLWPQKVAANGDGWGG
jgi:hypothetical protein